MNRVLWRLGSLSADSTRAAAARVPLDLDNVEAPLAADPVGLQRACGHEAPQRIWGEAQTMCRLTLAATVASTHEPGVGTPGCTLQFSPSCELRTRGCEAGHRPAR